MNTMKSFQKSLIIVLSMACIWAAMAPQALAFKSCNAAEISVPRRFIDVDGDGQLERFKAQFVVYPSGSAAGTATVIDGVETITFEIEFGEVNCNSGQVSLELSGTVTSETLQQISEIGNYTATMHPHIESPDCLIWEIDGNDVTDHYYFDVIGELITSNGNNSY